MTPTPTVATNSKRPSARRGTLRLRTKTVDGPLIVPVHYILPHGNLSAATMAVVMTGARRNAAEYADTWVRAALDTETVVLVPEFGREDFPNRWDYNAAGMVGPDGMVTPKSRWRFPLIGQVVDLARATWGVERETYRLWGHSAGAQFVHRFVMFGDTSDLIAAMAVNPVRFTELDFLAPMPAGLHGLNLSHSHWEKVFSTPLEIVLGGDDVEPIAITENDAMPAEDLENESPMLAGFKFFERARRFAGAHDVPFSWSLRVVPEIGHDHAKMSAHTGEQFLSEKYAG